MKAKKLQAVIDWTLLILIIGAVMYMGKIRMHQIALNSFLLLSFGIILCSIAVYRVVYIRLFLQKQKEDSPISMEKQD